MDQENNTFREWLDAKGISAPDAAKLIGVEPQTIHHWRSKGVPERRQKHVEVVMANYGKDAQASTRMLVEIKIPPSLPQLQAWHNAAQDAGQDLEQWSIDGLDALAAESEAENLRIAASPAGAAGQDVQEKNADVA